MEFDCREIDFEKCFYPGDDLGVKYNRKETSIRIWAPVAENVEICLFVDEKDERPELIKKLKKDVKGTWKKKIPGDWEGYYYLFRLYYGKKVLETVDPYAVGVGTDSQKGLIVDLEKTNPGGWSRDTGISFESPTEAVIYELHVRDFSISPHSGMENKGQYLAFTERGTSSPEGQLTGVEHLKDLGITHVHLLPVFDFASVEDNSEQYNWGYDPYYYNVPEGSYASNPADASRIREFKQMVQALHDSDLGVIMDVVYNHTYYTEKSPFQKIAPNYFYRFVENDEFANGSGCGNELATERPMVRKFIVDSICHWAREYHIDGFRFDLMGLMDKETMSQVETALHKINPSILLYGEPWAALPPQLEKEQQMVKGAQRGMQIAVFNDHFRNAIKGDPGGSYSGFLAGERREEEIKKGVVGATEYSPKIKDFAAGAAETVNYVSCHDNMTLWDKIRATFSELEEREWIKINRLAQAIIFTSQGIPFIMGGEEFLRTKYGEHNTYNAGDHYNQLKWERKNRYQETFAYYRGLIKLRRQHPAFQMVDYEQIKEKLHFLDTPTGTVGFVLGDYAHGDTWREIIVLYNPHREWKKFLLPEKKERGIVVDDSRAGVVSFNDFKADNVNVPPLSAMVLKAD